MKQLLKISMMILLEPLFIGAEIKIKNQQEENLKIIKIQI